MSVTVRTAVISDAHDIARVRVETWRAAYAGLIADEVLEGLDAEREGARRADVWDRNHADPRSAEFVAHVGGEVAGWAAVGAPGDDDLPDHGVVYAIYALPQFWGSGVGHALMDAAETFLRDAGYARGQLWMLDGNQRAAAFYERHGWTEDGGSKMDTRLVGGVEALALHERRRVKSLRG